MEAFSSKMALRVLFLESLLPHDFQAVKVGRAGRCVGMELHLGRNASWSASVPGKQSGRAQSGRAAF